MIDPRRVPSAAGAVVMATGAVSIALLHDGELLLSRGLGAVGCVAWVVLIGAAAAELVLDRAHLRRRVAQPGALTLVAGTAVLASRLGLAGARGAEAGLALLAAAAWPPLAVAAWRARPAGRVGPGLLLLAVAPSAIAVAAAAAARSYGTAWPAVAGLVPLALAPVAYVAVLVRLPRGMLRTAGGDVWIAGGAAAIMALACAEEIRGLAVWGTTGAAGAALRALEVLWLLVALVWLPLLVGAELRRPRLDYDVRRWATVFPLGVYAVAGFVAARSLGVPALGGFARIWTWVALAAWLVVAAAAVRARLSPRRPRRRRAPA